MAFPCHREDRLFLIISLREGVRFGFSDAEPVGALATPSGTLPEVDTFGSGFIAFYDFLRTRDGIPVAVRLILHKFAYGLEAALSGARGVRVDGEAILRIELLPLPPEDEWAAEQHLGSIRVFAEPGGGYALAIEACDISEEQAREMLAIQSRKGYRD